MEIIDGQKNKTNKYNGYKEGANTIIKLSNYIFHNTEQNTYLLLLYLKII